MTPKQKKQIDQIYHKWQRLARTTGPTDRAAAEQAVDELYVSAKRKPPRKRWYANPLEALPDVLASWRSWPTPATGVCAAILRNMCSRTEPYVLFTDEDIDEDEDDWEDAELDWDLADVVGGDFYRARSSFRWPKHALSAIRRVTARSIELQDYYRISRLIQRNVPSGASLNASLGYTRFIDTALFAQRIAATCMRAEAFSLLQPKQFSFPSLPAVEKLAASCGLWWMRGQSVILTDRFAALRFDRQTRLHCENGPALAWASENGVYYWHGVQVPKYVVMEPEAITINKIRRARNAETRRAMIERFGETRYMEEGGAKLIHEDAKGKLYRRRVEGRESVVMVRVENATPEPDGTKKVYWLRVPPNCKTATEAVAWTFNRPGHEYNPTEET